MKISPLQLTEYFVTEFHFTLNSSFKPDQPIELKLDELIVSNKCKCAEGDPRHWLVTMELKYQPAADTNTPYIFSLDLIGMFELSPRFDEMKIKLTVCTNGPSVLFGIAREIIRQQTARGPEGPFLLPSASFLPDDPPAAIEATVPRAELPSAEPTAPANTTSKPLTKARGVKKKSAQPARK